MKNQEGYQIENTKKVPSLDKWLKEAKEDAAASRCGMYLFHNGVVRRSAKARVRQGDKNAPEVVGMEFSYDKEKAEAALSETLAMEGVYYARIWLNEGNLKVGDDIMLVLVGGDTRPHVIDGLQALVGKIKSGCVTEKEIFA